MTLIENGDLWVEVRSPDFSKNRPALFLDRDGTLIELVDYLSDPADVVLVDAVIDDVAEANASGHAVVVVTNQSGIGRGYYDWASFQAVQNRMLELLEHRGCRVDAVYACPHPPPDAGGPKHSRYRKPASGMLFRAAGDLTLDLSRSIIIGDSVSDLAAGKTAGLPTGILSARGHASRDSAAIAALADESFEVLRR